MKSKSDKIQKQLHILRTGKSPDVVKVEVKTKEDRKKFWSNVMDVGESDAVKLKASELLGKSEADFADNDSPKTVNNILVPIMPMSIQGLHEAFRNINRTEGEQGLRVASSRLLAESNV